ncbi:MAG: PorV/PorQ family protein [Bacteroidetes bacterium]|nr:PorV/PorQ family protein [Bacteroidota bacterium]
MGRLYRNLKVLIVICILFPSFSIAQKYSNEFLSIGVGARAQALGNATVASVEDVTAGYWNPAGLSSIGSENGLQLGAMHSEWFAGVGKFDYFGFSLPLALPQRRIGISLIRFGIDDIPNTLHLFEEDGSINYDNIEEFSSADYAMLMSYAQPLKVKKGNLFIGGSVKVIHRQIGPFAKAWGFGIDIGAQYIHRSWRYGALLQDLTNTFNAWSFSFTEEEKEVLSITNNDIPKNSLELTRPSLLLGVAKKFQFGKAGLTPEVDIRFTFDGKRNTLIASKAVSLDPSFGLEFDYNQFLFLRAGINQFQKENDFDRDEYLSMRPSVGIGLKISSLQIDYAFTDLGDQRNTFSHVISLLLNLKPSKKDQ